LKRVSLFKENSMRIAAALCAISAIGLLGACAHKDDVAVADDTTTVAAAPAPAPAPAPVAEPAPAPEPAPLPADTGAAADTAARTGERG
jgi:hypothetical protein